MNPFQMVELMASMMTRDSSKWNSMFIQQTQNWYELTNIETRSRHPIIFFFTQIKPRDDKTNEHNSFDVHK